MDESLNICYVQNVINNIQLLKANKYFQEYWWMTKWHLTLATNVKVLQNSTHPMENKPWLGKDRGNNRQYHMIVQQTKSWRPAKRSHIHKTILSLQLTPDNTARKKDEWNITRNSLFIYITVKIFWFEYRIWFLIILLNADTGKRRHVASIPRSVSHWLPRYGRRAGAEPNPSYTLTAYVRVDRMLAGVLNET